MTRSRLNDSIASNLILSQAVKRLERERRKIFNKIDAYSSICMCARRTSTSTNSVELRSLRGTSCASQRLQPLRWQWSRLFVHCTFESKLQSNVHLFHFPMPLFTVSRKAEIPTTLRGNCRPKTGILDDSRKKCHFHCSAV